MLSKWGSRTHSLQAAALWSGAILVGLAAVLYARLVDWSQSRYRQLFESHPVAALVLTPFVFVAAAALVRRFAPDAKGSGIPQVLVAIHHGQTRDATTPDWTAPLISIRTAVIKVFSSMVGILGGASIGREGPTVQIAASVFGSVGRLAQRFGGREASRIKLANFLTAGAAAGVAAAFNTPLAGITFAIEEVLDGALAGFRQAMMVAVILAGITAQMLLGNYLYFGHPEIGPPGFGEFLGPALVIGVAGGLLGGFFSRLLSEPRMTRLPSHWMWRAFLCGVGCALLGYLSHGSTSGSGYVPTQEMLQAADDQSVRMLFPIEKAMTTALSYLSGMAGGIFSPSLSIGAGLGASLAALLHFSQFKMCALIGMVAFFSGVVQAPLTGVIVVTEMTDQHLLILPFMIAAFIAQGVGRWLMPVPLYHALAKRYIDA